MTRLNRDRSIVMISGLLYLVAACPAGAALIQYQFTGTVLDVVDPDHQLDGIVQLGDPYAAVFAFDTASPDLAPGDPTTGSYAGPSATLDMPNLDVQTTSHLFVHHDATGDYLRFSVSSSCLSPHFEIGFDDYTGTTLTGDMLPTTSAIAMFGQGWLSARWILDTAKFVASATVVPEPGAMVLLMLIGMTGLRAGRTWRI